MKVLFHSIEEGPHLMEISEDDMRATGIDQIIEDKCKVSYLRWDKERDVVILKASSVETYYDKVFTLVRLVK